MAQDRENGVLRGSLKSSSGCLYDDGDDDYLVTVFNKCTDDGLFPHIMKQIKCIALFKSGSSSDNSKEMFRNRP